MARRHRKCDVINGKVRDIVYNSTWPGPHWAARNFLCNEYRVIFRGVKWLGHKADHSQSASLGVQNNWRYTSLQVSIYYLHSSNFISSKKNQIFVRNICYISYEESMLCSSFCVRLKTMNIELWNLIWMWGNQGT